MITASSTEPAGRTSTLATALAEPFAFAMVTWPAVVGLLAPLPEPWGGYARIALAVWLAVMHFAAFGHGRGRSSAP